MCGRNRWRGFERVGEFQSVRGTNDAAAVPELSAAGHDFGGCRCQAALLTARALTDPVCTLSPNRNLIDRAISGVNEDTPTDTW